MKAFLLALVLAFSVLRVQAQAPFSEPMTQLADSLLRVLNTQDFETFQRFARRLPRVHTNDSPPWVHFELFRVRDLTTSYQEGMFYFRILAPLPGRAMGDGTGMSSTYKLRVISDGERPVYYQLDVALGSWDGKVERSYAETRPSVRAPEGYARLEAEYREQYEVPLRLEDVFRPEVTYGNRCNVSGSLVREQRQIDSLVARRDGAALTAWLQSGCTERQVFGVQGCHRLLQAGLPPTPQQLRLIRLIQQKKGQMSTCSGCSYERQDIRQVAGEFAF